MVSQSVSVVTSLQAGLSRIFFFKSQHGEESFLSPCSDNPASCSVINRGCFHGSRATRAWNFLLTFLKCTRRVLLLLSLLVWSSCGSVLHGAGSIALHLNYWVSHSEEKALSTPCLNMWTDADSITLCCVQDTRWWIKSSSHVAIFWQ
jgi:hypothetical protein